MKATLEFSLPEEQGEWQIHKQAHEMFSALHELERYFSLERKNPNSPEGVMDARERFYQILNQKDVQLDI